MVLIRGASQALPCAGCRWAAAGPLLASPWPSNNLPLCRKLALQWREDTVHDFLRNQTRQSVDADTLATEQRQQVWWWQRQQVLQ